MKCCECKYWQGTKYSEWGDCYRIINYLRPNLSRCFKTNEHGTLIDRFYVPFDPHDIKYWVYHSDFMRFYNSSIEHVFRFVHGIRVIEEYQDDILFDREGGERVGRILLRYYQTHRDFECRCKEDFNV